MGLLLFLPAGTFHYLEAWIFLLTLGIPATFVIFYFYKKDPEFIERRILKRREKEKDQKVLQNFLSLVFLIGLLIPGFDFRFDWSKVPLILTIVSSIFVFFGYLIMVLAMNKNRFASTIIETSDRQIVINSGPYRIVRHPMYSGAFIVFIFMPLALGSFWALFPFLFGVPVSLVLRIISEETYLIRNLSGYKDYCLKTKYRLIPFIW